MSRKITGLCSGKVIELSLLNHCMIFELYSGKCVDSLFYDNVVHFLIHLFPQKADQPTQAGEGCSFRICEPGRMTLSRACC